MDKSGYLSENLKEALEKFNKGMNDLKPIFDILDPVVKYCEILDEKLNPLYEKFKKVSETFDKVDLITKTMQRIGRYPAVGQKSNKDPYFNLFQ